MTTFWTSGIRNVLQTNPPLEDVYAIVSGVGDAVFGTVRMQCLVTVYEPNFPVVARDERDELEAVCGEMAERFADLFEGGRAAFGEAFERTALGERGWRFEDLSQYLFAKVQRTARELLEARGALEPRAPHRNGVEWVFWAESADR